MKSLNPSSSRSRHSAFTLIELLIVIVIIAILAAVAFPVTAMVMEQARKAEAKNEVRNLKGALTAYRMEYSKLPFTSGGGGGDLEMDTVQDDIVAILAGVNIDDLNHREKVFYEGKRAKGGEGKYRSGTYGNGASIRLVDPWGYPYFIIIDSDYNDVITGAPGMGGDELRSSIAVWSRGKPVEEDQGGGGTTFAGEGKWIKSWE